ncbi:MAG: pyridoxal-dependent decarboxylase [Chloroflexi bacterium]|jgi:glutamate/tyrosine decarboxylase-like PLP-dependent enzyme|nr:pyridoxal-dependent decarboxylase [Chloroflexota bacterium]
MHRYTDETERLAQAVLRYARDRMRMDPPLDGPYEPAEIAARAGRTITEDGMGGDAALRVFTDVIAPGVVSSDHPRYLAFIPTAPTEASTLFDLVVGASSIYGGSWLEGSGAVFAENQALRWIADLAGLPPGAGGAFVQGGTIGNLSALVAAREAARARRADGGRPVPGRWVVAATDEAHSSIAEAARVMDVDVLAVPGDDRGRLTGPALRAAIAAAEAADPATVDGLFAIVATAGATNLGIVDDIAGAADVAAERGAWLHVDGAYGGAALAAPSARHLFAGVEQADSFIVDPHKWLFAPYDACALLYRDPAAARAAHTQHAGYLDAVAHVEGEWNPSDYAIHLTRRARGLPFWFSLAMHGTRAYADAIEATIALAREAADEIRRRPYLELVVEPELSVVAFRRIGWERDDYERWSDRLLRTGVAFVTPTRHRGETITRFAIVSPRTTLADLTAILATMA